MMKEMINILYCLLVPFYRAMALLNDTGIWALLVLTVFVAIFIKWLFEVRWRMKYFPPGPWGLPVVGYLPWMDNEAHLTFDKLKSKYGSIFSVKLGSKTVVVLSNWEAVKATLVDQGHVFTGRPPSFTFDVASDRSSISFSEGEAWKNQRRLSIRCLRNIGIGKKTMESVVSDSVQQIISYLQNHNNKAVPMYSVFFRPLLNNVWRATSSHEFEEGNEEDEAFEAVVHQIAMGVRHNTPVNFFTWLRFLPPDGFGYWEFIRCNKKVWAYLRKQIDLHLANWKFGQNEDFIDEYIGEIKKHEDKPQEHLTYHMLAGALWDIFLAGVDTTHATTLWGMLYTCYFPETQVKLQKELDTVVGRHRAPSLDDIPNLPYLEAFLMETHRYASILVLSLPHCPEVTTQVLGYTIPKGTTCFQSIYGVHRDPTVWEEPDRFYPERFINEKNQAKWPPYLIPFSTGPRACIGESMAQLELRLIFSNLFHRFSFSFPPDEPRPTLEPQLTISQRPKPYSLVVKVRED